MISKQQGGAGAATGPMGLRVGVVGAGKVGAVVAKAFRAAGYAVVAASGRSEQSAERMAVLLPEVERCSVDDVVDRADIVLLTVPDDALAAVVAGQAERNGWHAGQIVVHTCGRFGLGVLEPADRAGAIVLALHPAMTFTGTSFDLGRLEGAAWGVTAAPVTFALAAAIVADLGGVCVPVAEADRGLYHAALAHGANHLTTVLAQAVRVLAAIGVDEPGVVLGPLVRTAVDRALDVGDLALTGPVVRGDVGTVRAHVRALAELAAQDDECRDVVTSYCSLAGATIDRCRRTGRLSAADAADLHAALAELGEDGTLGGAGEE